MCKHFRPIRSGLLGLAVLSVAGGCTANFRKFNLHSQSGRLVRSPSGLGALGGLDDTVTLAAVDSRERLYAGGMFRSFGSQQISGGLVRFDRTGNIDPTFALPPLVSASGQSVSRPTDIALAADEESLYICGGFVLTGGISTPRIARLKLDGAVDTNFGVGLGPELSPNAPSLKQVLVPSSMNGAIYVAGNFARFNGEPSPGGIVRLLKTGSVDPTFSVGTGANGTEVTFVLAGDQSGQLYAFGNFTNFNGVPANGLARINSDGSVDTSFAIGTGFSASIRGIYPASDGLGGLYVALQNSTGVTYQGAPLPTLFNRLQRDGSLDVQFSAPVGPIIHAALGTDGKVYVVAEKTFNSSLVYRINANGSRDTSFAETEISTGGGRLLALPRAIGGVVVYGGVTYVGGTTVSGLARLDNSGQLGSHYGVGVGIGGRSIRLVAPALDGSGDVYLFGDIRTFDKEVVKTPFVRANYDGSRDPAFDVGLGFIGGEIRTIAAAADGSGNIYVGGYFTAFNGAAVEKLVRLKPNGARDPDFSFPSSLASGVGSITPIPDDPAHRIYVSYTPISGTMNLVRLNADGTIDTSFNRPDLIGFVGLAKDGSGKLYGRISDGELLRLEADGSVDTTFNYLRSIGIASVAITKSGLYLAMRGDVIDLRLVKADGSLDPSFRTPVPAPGGFGYNLKVLAAPDDTGDVYVTGILYGVGPTDGLVRLNSDGSLDEKFSSGPAFVGGHANSALWDAMDGSGDIFVTGEFYNFNGAGRRAICRVSPERRAM